MRNFIFFFFSAVLISGCVFDENQQAERYYDHFPQWDTIMAEYEVKYPEVNKFLKTDSTSSRKTVKVDWEDELHLFKVADINKLNLIPKYTVDTISSSLAGETTYRFIPVSSGAKVSLAEYTFNEKNEWVSAHFIKSNSNKAFETEQELWFTKDLNYRIVSRQKVNLVFETDLVVEGHPVGSYREYMGMLNLSGEYFLRFNMYQKQLKDGTEEWVLHNGKERIELESVPSEGDTSVLKFPVFQSEFRYRTVEDTLSGWWYNFDKGDNYRIEFFAAPHMETRFLDEVKLDTTPNVSGTWEVEFREWEDNSTYPAIGIFEQHGNKVYGTFATETGDYRHLEGFIGNKYNNGRMLYLYTLDGAHAFYFRAVLRGDTLANGIFASGTHYMASWEAKRNENASLRDPSELTYLKEGGQSMQFEFPNLDGEMVALKDQQFENKVVLITVTGTWCPNCKDETEFLKEVYQKHRQDGLEVIALQFERSADFETAKAAVEQANEDLPVPYTQLIAGKAGAESAAQKLPMLNHIMSYPTLIVLNRNHEVVKIHTGFYGPGTGDYYTNFKAEMDQLLEELLEF